MPQLDAVIIRNLTYEAGRGKGKRTILNRINLTVPEGSIYGLLGPSGCGKTTMLRCVVGRIRARNGSVLVFGLRPNDSLSQVPGRDVGYMPQELSIYEDFTIEETLIYFGKINRMHTDEIAKRIEFLLQFLDLPSKKRLVANLSGGQKRRVSLAAALVHSPPLLILDEPTVGVDPLLRQSIWQHLVTLTQTERISVIITTHYIEEARQANVVGLMRHGKILAEDSPDELMRTHERDNLEDVFLKLCVTDSSRRAAALAEMSDPIKMGAQRLQSQATIEGGNSPTVDVDDDDDGDDDEHHNDNDANLKYRYGHRWDSLNQRGQEQQKDSSFITTSSTKQRDKASANHQFYNRPNNYLSTATAAAAELSAARIGQSKGPILIHTGGGTSRIKIKPTGQMVGGGGGGYSDPSDIQMVENFSSEDTDIDISETTSSSSTAAIRSPSSEEIELKANNHNHSYDTTMIKQAPVDQTNFRQLIERAARADLRQSDDYLAIQSMKWASRRSMMANNYHNIIGHHDHLRHHLHHSHHRATSSSQTIAAAARGSRSRLAAAERRQDDDNTNKLTQWWKTLMAVTWKNYVRLRRNPPVLVFQFMLPAIQVILFCLCIGGEPFDVPVAVVNDELVPRSSRRFLDGLNRRIIRQVKYDNLTSAMEAVRKGTVWGAIHIPDKYSQNLQSRLIMGEEVTKDTISNGTIRVYPDLTNLHLALALETTFRETFINFARDSLEELGYDRSLADLPIQIGKPVYGTMNKDGYLEFMAPGVVISISYVMATGLTALAFILERRDGLLERSLVSGVQTSQILLAHAINQVVVMMIQIFLVLGCTFFIFEIPSRGPFAWVVLLILLQGCTGMGFGLLVSAICKEENTAVMMVVGTFYTNLILAGIIWPIEAMPHWLRPLSYAQPQTLPTDTLRHILSRGWGILEPAVLLGFIVTIGWLVIFLMSAGLIFKYSR